MNARALALRALGGAGYYILLLARSRRRPRARPLWVCSRRSRPVPEQSSVADRELPAGSAHTAGISRRLRRRFTSIATS